MSSKMKWFMPLLLALAITLSWLLSGSLLVNKRASAAEISQNDVLRVTDIQSVTGVAPNKGWNDETTSVFINGTGFTGTMTVRLLIHQLHEIEVISSTRILAEVPPGLSQGLYHVRVEREEDGEQANLADGYEVLQAPDQDDLVSYPEWLWFDPMQLRIEGPNNRIGLNVQRLGGKATIEGVEVCFYYFGLEDERIDIGCGWTNNLSRGKVEATNPVSLPPLEGRRYTFCAEIDPNKLYDETNEDNNEGICRSVTVLDPTRDDIGCNDTDRTAPRVDSFQIADGAPNTTDVEVTLDVTATDPETPGRCGMGKIEFVEFEYLFQARRWVPVRRSLWKSYQDVKENYPWTLTNTYGMRYMQAWAKDKGNAISNIEDIGLDVINLVPSEQTGSVDEGEIVFYRMYLDEGQSFSATLTPLSGDPDLYVWGAQEMPWQSNNSESEDVVTFEAPDTGTYQIEVHGYSQADYRLTFGVTNTPLAHASLPAGSDEKPRPARPVIPVEPKELGDLPIFYDVDFAEEEPVNFQIYLPMTLR